jgi:hypothetical protein
MAKFRTYRDVHGTIRTLEYVMDVPHIVEWHKVYPASTATRWKLEDGSLVQIPDNVWSSLNLAYTEKEDDDSK